ncbi:hypothetical protein [Vibrio phage vB_VpS_PG28]|nr:hypothetical protein [Vibrio phage vB_VpS_PG28]
MANYTVNQTLNFNTGRHYSPEGQVIECVIIEFLPDEDGFDLFDEYRVQFHDKSRDIKGVVTVSELTQTAIMQEYDANNYEQI